MGKDQGRKKFVLSKESFRIGNANISSIDDSQESSTSDGKSNKSLAKTEAENRTSSGLDVDAWSEVQEKASIQAFKTFPKETNPRWERVATAVPGKMVNQRKKKFMLLKESLRDKKSGVYFVYC